ncbi:MAG: carbohydrate kinase [Chloroflexi bacterium]|nr:carbohydrate kinase [Chloroflexota bacterium]
MTLLVIDLGSSSARALLFNDDAGLIDGEICSRKHDFFTDNAGRATADAAELRRLVESCIDEILTHPAAGAVRAVGMASFAGNWLGLDADGQPCTPVLTYADTLSHSEIPALLQKLGGDADAYHQAVGCMLHPAYLPAQYARLLRAQPEIEARIDRVSDIGGYFYRQWFGIDAPVSFSMASWSGLLDTARRDWHWAYARLLVGERLLSKLPRLADYDQTPTGLASEYAARWVALRDVPFFLALGDGAAANVGSGAVDSSRIALTMGTTSALRVVKDIERVPRGLWRYLVCAGMPLIGGAASEGGNVYQWAMEALRGDDRGLDGQLSGRAADCHGLTVLPLLAGERSPGWQPDASGTIHGIRRSTSQLDILQAHMEAVAIRLSLIFDLLKAPGATVVAGGGALQASAAWAQMIADAFDSPLQLLADTEVTARGVALMMLKSLNGVDLADQPPRFSRIIAPDAGGVALLRAARERQAELYRRLYS